MNIRDMVRTTFRGLVPCLIPCFAIIGTALAQGAPGGPGSPGSWTYAGKSGVGTSYERYVNGQYGANNGPTGVISKVWFSISEGIITETAHGLIHEAQIKDVQLLVTGPGFFDEEKKDTDQRIEYLHVDGAGRPLSPAYRVVNTDRDGKYVIEKHVFTDPDRQALFMRVIFTANAAGITPYLLVNPHMGNTAGGDVAYVGADHLGARQNEDEYLVVRSSAPYVKVSAGFEGVSDGWQDLADNRVMDWAYPWAENGNVAMTAQLPTLNAASATWDFAFGFGPSHAAAMAEADGALTDGYQTVLDKFNGAGAAIGWEDYLAGLSELPALRALTGDGGKLIHASAIVLKTLEDKSNAGALIASLSIPWGDVRSAGEYKTGYRAVWPRDFYQCAMALLALGDKETPVVAFKYLEKVQVRPGTPGNRGAAGWFLQKTHVDGVQEWHRVQMDQTAMPVMLGWRLWQAGLLSNAGIADWYRRMLKPAAEFLANGGRVDIGDESPYTIAPPWTRLERWEEQAGYSPSNTAAVVTGLIVAADIARQAGDGDAAGWYESRADLFAANIERWMFTTNGSAPAGGGNGRHYLRITGDQDPGDGDPVEAANGRPALDERLMLDPGFLELVRYGVRPANDPYVLDSLAELDAASLPDELRVRYEFPCVGAKVSGWRRYGNDGYGERTDNGSAYSPNERDQHPAQRGRVWPFLTGERGHFELERLKAQSGGTLSPAGIDGLRTAYVKAMECFANNGLMLPEQVWDGVGANATYNFTLGEGTDGATPLAWSHAEYVKLVRSLADRNTWDSYSIVRARYAAPYASEFVQVFLRGTWNGWDSTAMQLVADHKWQLKDVPFGGAADERFKFDVYGDWSLNFGDNGQDGTTEADGEDIPITAGKGLYAITLDDRTGKYQVVKQ
ncbi:glucoamylase [Skermanella aerolata]|uniref:glucan 1,4-alpha-glucosidase n=1 Tax=Skermanella aerolata TaxID=393310 RepID=UPI003D1963A8